MPGINRQEFLTHAEQLLEEGQGVCHIECFDRKTVADLLLYELLHGMPDNPTQASVVNVAQELAGGEKNVDCLLCGRNLNQTRLPSAVAILHADRDDPRAGLALCICNRCYVNDPNKLMGKILAYLKAHLSPDMRRLEIHTSSGRA